MAELTRYATSPLGFIYRYIRMRPVSHAVILAAVLGAVVCSVGTQYGVKFLVDTLSTGRQCRRVDGVLSSRVADCSRQSVVARRQLDRQLRLRRRHRRSAPRSVPPSDRAFARLLRRPAAGHADKPRHRDLERGLHRREYARLERTAAVRGNHRGDRAGLHYQFADGRGARARRRHHGFRVVPARGLRPSACTTISPPRRRPSTAK